MKTRLVCLLITYVIHKYIKNLTDSDFNFGLWVICMIVISTIQGYHTSGLLFKGQTNRYRYRHPKLFLIVDSFYFVVAEVIVLLQVNCISTGLLLYKGPILMYRVAASEPFALSEDLLAAV